MQTEPNHFKSVSIIGLGLIGGSFARRIRAALPDTRIAAWDTRPECLLQAQAEGTIDVLLSGETDPAGLQSDLVVLGVHLSESRRLLEQIACEATQPRYVMDLGSTKGSLCRLADTLPESLRFIGGHPLAGREISGYENSLPNLFLGRRFLLTPCSKTPPDFQERITAWLSQLGMHPIVLNPDAHDRLMALVSHFPQFYAIALANLLAENHPEETLRFLGGGLDDQMRLMASPYGMWRDIFQDNRAALGNVLDAFIDELTRMRQALDEDGLAPWFDTSHAVYGTYQALRQTSTPYSAAVSSGK